jgi:NAD-dependent SIR2 family protein deacetylase
MGFQDRDYLSELGSGSRQVCTCTRCGHWIHACTCESDRRRKIPRLSGCPDCHERSLFYDSLADNFFALLKGHTKRKPAPKSTKLYWC